MGPTRIQYAENSREFDDICNKMETLTRDVDEAYAAWQAAQEVAEAAHKVRLPHCRLWVQSVALAE